MKHTFPSKQITVRVAMPADREEIYRQRHEIYACELGQHAPNAEGSLTDALDGFNVYILALRDGVLAGFISITPPGRGLYSVDKYIRREEFPTLNCQRLYEIRLLSLPVHFRKREIAGLLMYAALRWVESQGGERLVAIGRREVLDLYLHVGMETLGRQIQSGAVTFELMSAGVAQLSARMKEFTAVLNRFERIVDWQLEVPFRPPTACFHGGAFFDAIGPEFDHLEKRSDIINGDVLDAWFPPSPRVLARLETDLPWLLRTSPPTRCEGMIRVIARVRGVPEECVLPAAGSSDAIFLALREWLTPSSRVLILDPTYGEYAHVLARVVRCRVERFELERREGYEVNAGKLTEALAEPYDLVVLVNPNSPTGRHIPRAVLERILRCVREATLVWVDETYVEYAGRDESLEAFAVSSRNVVVCKSMSKVYALSGARAAYLCGPVRIIEGLRSVTPPWPVSLLAQVAAVAALQDPEYYAAKYAETHQLREQLAGELSHFAGWEVIPSVANFLLCHLPEAGADAATLVADCRRLGLYLRDASPMGRNLGRHALRIAVKDAETNRQAVRSLARVLGK